MPDSDATTATSQKASYSIRGLVRLSPVLALIALAAALAWIASHPADQPFRTLTDLGAKIEIMPDKSYFVTLPDLIDPELAITNLKQIGRVSHIHFDAGSSPPDDTINRDWEWLESDAQARIRKFRDSFPDTKFTFWVGAF